jgi:uncharacterized membrane protein
MIPAYHSMLVHLITAPLLITFFAVTFRFWLQPRSGPGLTLARACDPVAFYSSLFGMIVVLLTFVTGIMLRPLEAFLNSPISKNKIILALLTMLCWYAWMFLRLRLGRLIWDRSRFHAHFAYVMILAATLFLIATNSIGGQLAGNPSGYEMFAKALGYRTRQALYFPTVLNVALVVAGLAVLVGAVFAERRRPALSPPGTDRKH